VFSPWLRLSEKNTGGIDAYHTVVRPEIQLQQTLRQQALTNRQQAEQLHGLGTQVAGMENTDTMRPTGIYGGFMDYSHYYPAGNRAPAGAARTWSPSRAVPRAMPGNVH
jgi:hypothetical protein